MMKDTHDSNGLIEVSKPASPERRDFLEASCCGLLAILAAAGLNPEVARALPVAATQGKAQGSELSYPIPPADAVHIDNDNQVILVRSANHVYAFSLACPHQNTALRWREQQHRFQCPRHNSKYQPDGVFMSGRATRNMDRFAIRREGQNVAVDVSKLFRSDRQKAEWDAAVVAL